MGYHYILDRKTILFCLIYLDINDCEPNPCQNGGVCVDGNNDHTCNCVTGYGGDNCEIGKFSIMS